MQEWCAEANNNPDHEARVREAGFGHDNQEGPSKTDEDANCAKPLKRFEPDAQANGVSKNRYETHYHGHDPNRQLSLGRVEDGVSKRETDQAKF